MHASSLLLLLLLFFSLWLVIMDWLTFNDSVWSKWLGRVVVTIVLCVAYHWFSGGFSQPKSAPGVTLQRDWKTKRIEDLEKRLASLEQEKQDASEDKAMYEEEIVIESEEEDYVEVDPKEAADMLNQYKEQVKEANAGKEDEKEAEEPSPELKEDEVKAEEQVEEPPKEEGKDVKPKKKGSELITSSVVHETAQHRRQRARNRVAPRRNTTTRQEPQSSNPPIAATSDDHPGLDQFYHWYNTETSLYRIYELGRTDDVQVVPPFHPASERGKVPVALIVGNKYYEQINVFWTDYKGREVPKGSIPSSGTWHQTTWIGHPWTFRTVSGEVLLHYIPYRIIPTTKQVPTTDPNDTSVGLHQFVIGRPAWGPYSCSVSDPVLPHPPEKALDTPVKAAQWTLQHMTRTGFMGGEVLAKYLTNIVAHPENPKYRQIRTAQAKFNAAVWNTAARGLLLAAGFTEREAFAELGTMSKLSRERVRDISTLLFALEQWRMQQGETTVYDQPEGADGYGRGGYGRAGEMNSL